MKDNTELLMQIMQNLNDFQVQTMIGFNELRGEIKKSREIENEHWQENLRLWEENKKRWEENEKRWEENDKRWEKNEKRWEENDKRWGKNEKDRERDHKELLDILLKFDIVISRKIGDPNVDKMAKVLKIK